VDRRYRAGVMTSAGGQHTDRTVARGTLPSQRDNCGLPKRSLRLVDPGLRGGWRAPACSAANSRPPQCSCSPGPCPVTWNPAQMTPGPARSGQASGRAPTATPAPEQRDQGAGSSPGQGRPPGCPAGIVPPARHRRNIIRNHPGTPSRLRRPSPRANPGARGWHGSRVSGCWQVTRRTCRAMHLVAGHSSAPIEAKFAVSTRRSPLGARRSRMRRCTAT
jgi:hypothetical protein